MAKAPTPPQPPIAGSVMFYKSPTPLSKANHTGFGVKQLEKPFDFMAKSHFVPITAPEFGQASASFPVIFAGPEKAPLAVMGIRAEENVFIEEGQFLGDYYLPNFARRYPFVLAGDNTTDRFVVCIDKDADCVTNKKPDQPFFDGDDTSAFTKEAFEFLQNFERDRQATQVMIDRFKELDLFEQKEMNFQGQNADGSPAPKQKIADYFAITDERLRGLDEKTSQEFLKNGYLAVAHAHIISLGNWQRLVNMTLRRSAAEQAKSNA